MQENYPVVKDPLSVIPNPNEESAEALISKLDGMLAFAESGQEMHWDVTAGGDYLSIVDCIRSTPGFLFRISTDIEKMDQADFVSAFDVIAEFLDKHIPASAGWKFNFKNLDFQHSRRV